MIKKLIMILLLLVINNCGKKGELFLEGVDRDSIIEIDEERAYKF